MNDSYEMLTSPTDSLDNDTDDDSLLDGAELLTYGTNTVLNDTDVDFLSDGEEVLTIGSDLLNNNKHGDGVLDEVDDDPLVASSGGQPPYLVFVFVGVVMATVVVHFLIVWKKRK